MAAMSGLPKMSRQTVKYCKAVTTSLCLKMALEFKPASLSYSVEKPFDIISGKAVAQENVAENAVKIRFEFDKPLEKK